jgi:glutamate formiminotransferase/formiminotetrahydrofolate cyclodeaminase
MAKIVECVPNFSEGRRREVVDALVEAITSVPGALMLDSEMDADHNRSVLTFAGEPEPVMEAAFRVAQKAATLIDLNTHAGQHPRMGATDVVPFVPVQDLTLADCAEMARLVGRRIGEELEIPVFLYEAAATRPDRVTLSDVRKGEFEGLREAIGQDPTRAPDFGPARIHPTAGATAVGARKFLVAFNANLNTGDVRVAKAIASAIRERSGGLKNVRALGFSIEDGRRAQVSMNLVDTEATPIHRVLALIREEAARRGAAISGCEVVGLIPEYAVLDAAEHALQLEEFRRDQVLEQRLARPPVSGALTFTGLLDQIAASTPTPGGGTVAALVGALGAALARMVANLTRGKKKYASVEEEMGTLIREAEALQQRLVGLARRDSEAFEAVLRARRMAQTTPEEQAAREKAVATAEVEAAHVPAETAEACRATLVLAERAARLGNVNAVSDAGVAGLLAGAAGEGALLNVAINLKYMAASPDRDAVAADLRRLRDALTTEATRCRDAVAAVLEG